MDLNSSNRSPIEEGELEDGEICDDETEENVLVQLEDLRPIRNSSRAKQKSHQHPHHLPPLMPPQPSDFRLLMPYNLGPHLHGPFPSSHRQQCGPSGPDRPPPPGLGPHCDQGPRSSFWERSHSALGRFRHRATPSRGRGNWCWGGREAGRPPPGRYGAGESHGNKRESPTRKRILCV